MNVNKSKIEKLFEDMVSKSNGVRVQLPEGIDPGHTKQRRGKFKPIEFVCVPSDPEKTQGDCWVCVSHGRNTGGHIQYFVKDAKGKAKGTSLHRVIYEMWMGKELPPDLYACHSCDVPFCINPAHIFPGTIQDNHADMMAKGRHVATEGEQHHNAKLTLKDAWNIRLRYLREGVSQKVLADDYGVSPSAISGIISFKTWRLR